MDTIGFYDANAADYARHGLGETWLEHLLAFAGPLARNAKILDLGCGGGHCTKWLMEHGFAVTPLDGSKALAAETEKLTGLAVRVLRFESLDYDMEFDAIWASASLLHVRFEALPDIWRKLNRALKAGGRLYASFKDLDDDQTDRFGRFFCHMSMDELDEQVTLAGFEVERSFRVPGKGTDGVPVHWLCVIARNVI